MNKMLKTVSILLVLVTTMLVATRPAYATELDVCDTDISKSMDPSPVQIVCPIYRTLNIFMWLGAAALVMMIFLSAYKFAMSQGDPKGYEGAKQTLTYAVMGFLVVLGTWTVLILIKNVFGLQDFVLNPFELLARKIRELAEISFITFN